MGPLWGTWGPYLGIPSVEYFPNVFFSTSRTPWASPYLQMQWRPLKKLENFPRGSGVPGFGGAVNMSSTSCLSTSDVTWLGGVRRAWPFRSAMYTHQCSCIHQGQLSSLTQLYYVCFSHSTISGKKCDFHTFKFYLSCF